MPDCERGACDRSGGQPDHGGARELQAHGDLGARGEDGEGGGGEEQSAQVDVRFPDPQIQHNLRTYSIDVYPQQCFDEDINDKILNGKIRVGGRGHREASGTKAEGFSSHSFFPSEDDTGEISSISSRCESLR